MPKQTRKNVRQAQPRREDMQPPAEDQISLAVGYTYSIPTEDHVVPPTDSSPPTTEEQLISGLYGVDDLGQVGLNGVRQIETWRRQEAFLSIYRQRGTKGLCAIAAGVHRETVRIWERTDLFKFNARLQDALEVYADKHDERLSELGFETLQPLPTIAKLNAYRPDRYRRETLVVDTKVLSALDEIKKMAFDARQRALAVPDAGMEAEEMLEARAEAIVEGKRVEGEREGLGVEEEEARG